MLSIADLIFLAGTFPDLELRWGQGPPTPAWQPCGTSLKVLFRVISPWKEKVNWQVFTNVVYLSISGESPN